MTIFSRFRNDRENSVENAGREISGESEEEIFEIEIKSEVGTELRARVAGMEQIVAYLDNKVEGLQKIMGEMAEIKSELYSIKNVLSEVSTKIEELTFYETFYKSYQLNKKIEKSANNDSKKSEVG
jgi:uncharacterized protein involved in exopolysaccharide biosynthesis